MVFNLFKICFKIFNEKPKKCSDFVEITGKVIDLRV